MLALGRYSNSTEEIEAIQFSNGNLLADIIIIKLLGDKFSGGDRVNRCFIIKKLDNMKINHKDYLIKDSSGNFYSCKPDIFEKTYNILY